MPLTNRLALRPNPRHLPRFIMTTVLTSPSDAAESLERARTEMERRAAARQKVEEHLESCGQCADVLCSAGTELVREALR